jgi:hypothetical protein
VRITGSVPVYLGAPNVADFALANHSYIAVAYRAIRPAESRSLCMHWRHTFSLTHRGVGGPRVVGLIADAKTVAPRQTEWGCSGVVPG